MTQPPIPPPPPVEHPAGPAATVMPIHAVAAPWSALAISAFVCALLGFLGFTAILGIILGVAGIVVTGGGKRRGLGLAIAALPISLVTGLLSVLLLLVILVSVKVMATVAAIAPLFDAGAPDRASALAEFRTFTSQSFDDSVSNEQFFAWIDRIVKEHGKLTSVSAKYGPGGAQPTTETDGDGRFAFSLPAKFVGGPATIRVVFRSDGFYEARLDDISVGGVSPRGSP